MRIVELNTLEGGITRLRSKGGANPKWLYDLLNGYVLQDGSIQSRPGTTDEITLPANTKGLCAVNGALVVFSNSPKTITDSRVTCEVLTHPDDPNIAIAEIHFAGPFLGGDAGAYLYVVAEFADGQVFHYWLQRAETWTAATVYTQGEMVEPTVPNGYLYRATRLDAAETVWAAGVLRTVGDVVEPTVFNSYRYTVVSTLGANPRSGTVEPTWPTADGAQVIEDTNGVPTPTPTTGGTDTTGTPNTGTRYTNPGGSTPGLTSTGLSL
jgi:hypothetical protein